MLFRSCRTISYRGFSTVSVNGLRVSINEACNRQRSRSILFGDLIDHYKQTELCDRSEWYSEATKVIYAEFLKTWIRPHCAKMNIRDVRTIVVENWLRQLRRKDGSPLANTTKTKIRSLMSVLFNHAIRYEWLEQGKNPITLVRQSTARQKAPEVLDPKEISRSAFPFGFPLSIDGFARCDDRFATQRIVCPEMGRH